MMQPESYGYILYYDYVMVISQCTGINMLKGHFKCFVWPGQTVNLSIYDSGTDQLLKNVPLNYGSFSLAIIHVQETFVKLFYFDVTLAT